MASQANTIFERIAKSQPELKLKLKQAGMPEKGEEFVKKTILGASYISFGLVAFLFLLLSKLGAFKPVFLLSIPITFLVFYGYLKKLPDAKIAKKTNLISKEIVFAGRFIIVELESGVPLYNAMINVSKNYEILGAYFKEIIDKVDLGTSMEDALNEAVEDIPSNDLRKILWQVINSLRTGSNVAKSLYSVMDQITKDQMTQVNEYGKKLNPLAMFYMVVAVILPSLGITMLIILSSFINLRLNLTFLIVLASFLGLLQLMFISLVKMSRPAIEF